MTGVALSCRSVSVRFGEFRALEEVSLHFQDGKTTALIGPNGAGKTTLLNVLAGVIKPTSGAVELRDQDVTQAANFVRARLGLGRSFQTVSVFPEMTVFENARLALQRQQMRVGVPWRTVDSFSRLRVRTLELLSEFGLEKHRSSLAGALSHGEQRALELAISVAGEPSVLLLDEPLAGVGHGDLEHFVELVDKVAKRRTTVLVEHNMDVVMSLADEVVVLVAGSVLFQGTPQQVKGEQRVREAYLGE